MTWYVSDLARYRSERQDLDSLEQNTDWFIIVGWRIDESIRLVLDAEIVAGDSSYPVFLRYPSLFPHTPPSVFPRGDTTRWSEHQFGVGGELCLEYGPDNWATELTGVKVIESAHRLLEAENPQTGEAQAVPSRHQTTLGQELRGRANRLLLTRQVEAFLSSVPTGVPFIGGLILCRHDEVHVYVINQITQQDGATWVDQTVPTQLVEECPSFALVIFRIGTESPLPISRNVEELREACSALGLTVQQPYVVLLQGQMVHPAYLWERQNKVVQLAVIPATVEQPRLDAPHEQLKEKGVALIGCGSLGSKVGSMLARSGVGRFVLVDDDVLLPDNLIRNDLDWRDIGTHKVAAVARRMQLVNPSVETQTRRSRMAGQESSETAETLLNMVADCDLIFDATANPDILNLMSAVVAFAKKPVIWAEVFGGAIGGLIARCRPGIEPSPQHMRWAIENWFGERGTPVPVSPKRSYLTGSDAAPLIADDADVAVIAAHAARFAIDTLIPREPSHYPYSVYAIGLANGSVFSQPFDTHPIDVGPCPASEAGQELSQEEQIAEIARILELFKARVNAPANPDQNNQSP